MINSDIWLFLACLDGSISLFDKIVSLSLFDKIFLIKYVEFNHYFGNIYECTTLLELEFFEKITFKFTVLFFMKLELHKKISVYFL